MMRQVKTNLVTALAICGFFATSFADAQMMLDLNTPIPMSIGAAGSYKLGSNIYVGPTGNGINIVGNDITLDLNGYSISGNNVNGCNKQTGHPAGNSCDAAFNSTTQVLLNIAGARVTVKNGSITGSTGFGVAIKAPYAHLESLAISSNKGFGITASSLGTGSSVVRSGTTLTNVTSVLNGTTGFDGPEWGFGDVLVKNSVFSDNASGILIYDGVLDGVTASYNKNYGIRGNRAVITNATVIGNTGDGISDGAIVKNVAARGNVTGFKTSSGDGTIYIDDAATFNSTGFSLNSYGCYSNIVTANNSAVQLIGGVALTGTHVTCP